LSAVNQAQLFSLCSDFERVGRLPSAQQDPQRVGDLESRLVAWLAREIANQAGLQPLSPRSRHRVEALSRWIDAHLAENIDLGRLATVAGVGPRALAKLCVAARGVTPMQLLQARRLAAARRLLEQGGEGIRVARIAHECGFNHLGRFAGAYGDAYGEAPSDTLARSRPPDRELAG
jgi:transcriptional regulator GlxA family with amidase domain